MGAIHERGTVAKPQPIPREKPRKRKKVGHKNQLAGIFCVLAFARELLKLYNDL